MNNTMRVFFSIMWYKNLVKISKKLETLVDLRVEFLKKKKFQLFG